jgi:hypothetical protein
VAVGDIDGDGGPEAVFAARAGNSIVAYAGGVLTHTLLPGTSDGRAVTLANLSGDALPEIVSVEADGNALIYPNTGGTFPTPVTLPVGGATSVTAADFDGDGDVDLAFGVGSFGAARKLPANAVFENVSSAAGPEFVRVGDLGASETIAIVTDDVDGNGAADLIAVNASGSHKVYMNDGAGTFAELAHRFETNGAVAVAIGAVGPDSRADVIVTGPDGTSIFYNDGSGNFGLGDTEAPIITLLGPVTMEILVESAFEDPGATAMDGADGDLTSFIIVENPVDPAIVGEQTVTYTVTDSSGNVAAPVTRRVRVLVAEAVGGGGGGAFGPGLLVLVLVTQLCAVARWCRPLPGRAPLRRPPADSGHSRHRYR